MIYDKNRKKMVERLKEMGISDNKVLKAMGEVPRHEFLPSGLEFQAYDEKALPIGSGQTISHPYTVALMTQTLQVHKNQKILEIGTGSGYQSAVLTQMGVNVYSIEKVKSIGLQARATLHRLNYHVLTKIGDGTLGWSQYAPYDAIIITAGAPVVPETLIDQLSENGKLLLPVGDKDSQILTLYIKEEGELRIFRIEEMKFVPLIGKEGW
jgi:protein-L-isoaspartate(D-aspartate) O-methyltransferase